MALWERSVWYEEQRGPGGSGAQRGEECAEERRPAGSQEGQGEGWPGGRGMEGLHSIPMSVCVCV